MLQGGVQTHCAPCNAEPLWFINSTKTKNLKSKTSDASNRTPLLHRLSFNRVRSACTRHYRTRERLDRCDPESHRLLPDWRRPAQRYRNVKWLTCGRMH